MINIFVLIYFYQILRTYPEMDGRPPFLNIIENTFASVFKATLEEQFQDQQIIAFREDIIANPGNYESIITARLGSGKRYTQIINSLKSNTEFLKGIDISQVKLIHNFPMANINLGLNTNFIYTFNFDSNVEWNLQNIIMQLDSAQKNMIKEQIEKSKSFQQFFMKIQDYFIDYCIRRLDITEIIACINRVAIQASKIPSQLKQMLTQLTCSDFIRLYSHFYIKKSYFGLILHRLSIPVPYLFTTKSSQGQIEMIHSQLLNSIINQNDYCLITNIGSSKMIGKGKTSFLQKMFLLKKKMLSNSKSNFHEGAVDFYTKLPHKIKNKNILIADFHGDYLRQNQHYKQLLNKCLQHSSLILVHINESQMKADPKKGSLFVRQYYDKLQDQFSKATGQILIMVRDCNSVNEEVLLETMESFKCIKFPSLLDEQIKSQTVFNLKCQKLYQFMQELPAQSVKEIDYSMFLNYQQLQENIKNKAEVQRIMNILRKLFKKQNFYSEMFPNLDNQLKRLYLKQDIVKYQNQLNRDIQDSQKILKLYNVAKTELERLIKEPSIRLSQLVEEALHTLEQKFTMMQLLSDSLTAWRGKQTEQFIKFIIAKNAHYDKINKQKDIRKEQLEQLKQIIKDAEIKLQTYDISVDTLFSEVIAAMQKDSNNFGDKQKILIKRHYKQAYESITPINLIQGKTLQYGNPFLEQFLDELSNEKYADKQVFVVSVVGAQSSAKSTILNYIFRCNFATSVGRCTKGVYLTIVECEQKVIIVIDTEGLLSVAARNNTFDVQIACFVMLISDLVIINNKGEVDTTLKNLLGVCVYVIDRLNSTEVNVPYQPNRVIFTIRDQVQYGGTKQQQMLSQIISSLNQNSKIQYSKYMNFTDQDIYPLQSAFVPQNQGIFCLEGANNSFGKSILTLRSRIIGMLQTPKNRNLSHFYANSKRRWQAIQNCGDNIFNFKSMYEIQIKEDIKKILQKIKKTSYKQILQKQQSIVSCFLNKEIQKQSEIYDELKINYAKTKRDLLEHFHRKCEEKINQKKFISDLNFQIQEFCTTCYNDFVAKLKKRLLEIRFNQDNKNFKKFIRETLKNSYANGKKDEQILKQLQIQTQSIESQLKSQMARLEQTKNSMGKNQLSLQITRKVQNFLRSYYVQCKIQYMNLPQLKEDNRKIQIYKSRKESQILGFFHSNYKTIDDQKYKIELQQIIKKIINFLNQCDKSVSSLIKFEFNANIDAIEPLMLKIMQQLNIDFDILNQNIKVITNRKQMPTFQMQHRGVILSRFISTFPIKFQKTYYESSKLNLQKRYFEMQVAVTDLTNQVKQSLKIRGNAKETARLWIKKIINRQLARFFQFSQQIIQRELQQICSFLNPRDIIKMAMQNSFKTSKTRNKQRWFNCFKVIKNINRYLKQFLYEQRDYRQLQHKLETAKADASKKINQFVKKQMAAQIQSSIILKMQSTIDMPRRNVEYYQNSFGIDLATFKNDQWEQRLDQVLFCMWNCIQETKKQNSTELEYYKQYVMVQIQDLTLKLRQQIQTFIKEKIEPIVIGCQERCPGCGMKCFKTGGHVDGHALLKDCHLMQCFAGRVYNEDGTRSCDLCFTQQNINKKYIKLQATNKEVKVIDWIRQRHPDWLDHFLTKGLYQNQKRKKQCNTIWANIEYVIIKYKYPYMIPDKDNWKYQYDPLDEDDIILNKLQKY